jgi:hypothetical protein
VWSRSRGGYSHFGNSKSTPHIFMPVMMAAGSYMMLSEMRMQPWHRKVH